MDYVALDTDVAVTFVTLAELTEWAIVRAWGRRTVAVLAQRFTPPLSE